MSTSKLELSILFVSTVLSEQKLYARHEISGVMLESELASLPALGTTSLSNSRGLYIDRGEVILAPCARPEIVQEGAFDCYPLYHLGDLAPQQKKKKKELSDCRGEGSAAGLQLRVRFVPAALALQCVSKARDWTGHVDRWLVFSLLLTAIAGVRLSPY
jgi:hypothetical protein